MKLTKILLAGSLAVAATSAFAGTSDTDDMSYSVGYSMGKNLQMQLAQGGIEVDNSQVEAGLTDGIKGQDSKLSDEQMQKAMMSLQQQAMANAQKAQQSK